MIRCAGVPVACIGARLWRVALVVAVAACGETIDSDVCLAPESRAERIVFLTGASPLLYKLSAFPCGSERSVWTIGREGTNSAPPARIVFGETPPGYVERVHVQSLRPGCYRVVVSGPRSAQFIVNRDGTVSNQPARRNTSGTRSPDAGGP
jgi:hypothetical protein